MVKHHGYLLVFIGLTLNVYANEQQLPDMELLEFLADWETEDDQWLDPEQLLEMPELAEHNEEQDKNEE